MTGTHQPDATRRNQTKWLHPYLLLAVFVVLTLAAGDWFTHRLIVTHCDSLRINRQWVKRLITADELARLASAVVKPANDVLQSRDPAVEAVRLRAAHSLFDNALTAQIQELQVLLEAEERELLTRDCRDIEAQMEQVIAGSNLVFANVRDGDWARAAERLPGVNKDYDDVLVALNHLRTHYREHRAAFMDAQQAQAADLGRLEYFMTGLVLVVVAGFTLYGVRLSRQMHASETRYNASQDAIQSLHRRNELILQSTGEGIYGLDLEGNTTFVNPAALKLLGYTREELIGKPQHALIHHTRPDGRPYPSEECPIHATFTDGSVHHINDEVFWRKDGSNFPVEYFSNPMNDERGGVIGAVATFKDITARKQAEEAVRAKNAELEQFTYAVSHDLRSPLVTIQTFLGHLEQDMATADAGRIAKDVNFIHAAVNKMEELLKELGELSRVGRQMNTPEDVSLPAVVNEAVAVVAGRISERGVQVVITETPAVLHGDRARLVAVFQNLVDNACKFMGGQPAPRIEIGCEALAGETVFFVRDNGIGIDLRHQAKVFDLFEKLDPDAEGTGIGLALVKRIVEFYGGRVWVESKGVGHGTCFYFTLPRATEATNQGEEL